MGFVMGNKDFFVSDVHGKYNFVPNTSVRPLYVNANLKTGQRYLSLEEQFLTRQIRSGIKPEEQHETPFQILNLIIDGKKRNVPPVLCWRSIVKCRWVLRVQF